MEESILRLFPPQQRSLWAKAAGRQQQLQEIRLRVNRPVLLYLNGREYFLNEQGDLTGEPENAVRMDRQALEAILNTVCQDSFYAYEDELKQGFLTAAGGHRIGVSGQAVLDEGGRLRTIKNISFVNIRIAHQVKGAADHALPLAYRDGELVNTLILAPPACGKTTLLRDLIRQVSDGNKYGEGLTVGVVDERSELAGSFLGVPQNDLGMRTDVLDGCPKAEGMLLLLRAMSPKVIAIDELGSREEMEALGRAAACGCRILATAHGQTFADMKTRFGIGEEECRNLFQTVLCLLKKEDRFLIKPLWGKETADAETDRCGDDIGGLLRAGDLVSRPISGPDKVPPDAAADPGSLGERSALWQGCAGGMLPAYANTASGTIQKLL